MQASAQLRGALRAAGFIALTCSGACGGGAGAPDSATSAGSWAAPNAPFAELLRIAQALSARATALRAPTSEDLERVRGDGGVDSTAMDAALIDWARRRAQATVLADDAYARALYRAVTADDELALRTELGEMWLEFLVEIEHALGAAAPEWARNDVTFRASVRRDVDAAFGRIRARVVRYADQCLSLVDDSAVPGPYVARCQAVGGRLAATAPPPVVPAPPPGSGAPAAAAAANTRAFVSTTRPRPCVFRGSAAVAGRVWDAPKSGDAEDISALEPIEVASLEVPKKDGGRYRVELTHPRTATAWLEPLGGALQLTRPVEIVADHLWAPEGLRVQAADVRGPTVRVQILPGAAAGLGSRSLARRVFCHDLMLATATDPAVAAGPPDDDGRGQPIRLKVPVALAAQPGGRSVARITEVHAAREIERKGKFVRVRGAGSLLFDGWVPVGAVQPRSVAEPGRTR